MVVRSVAAVNRRKRGNAVAGHRLGQARGMADDLVGENGLWGKRSL